MFDFQHAHVNPIFRIIPAVASAETQIATVK